MLETPRRKVRSAPLSSPGRANSSHFGGLEAQALQGAGNAVQGVANDLDNLSKRQDTYAAQNAYLSARQEASRFVNDQMLLEGENAFKASFNTQMKLLDIESKATEGMTARQKNLFVQNWKPAAIQDQERVAVHQQEQVRSAERGTRVAMVDASTRDFVNNGSELDLAQAKSSLTALSSLQGWTPEEFEEKWTVARDYALASRVNALVSAEDFVGAQETIEQYRTELDRNQVDQMSLQIEQAEASRRRRIESKAVAQTRDAQIQEQVFILEKDPLATPPLEKYFEWYGPQLGRIKHNERLQATAELHKKFVTTSEKVDRLKTLQNAADVVEEIYSGKTDFDDVYPVINTLVIDGSPAAKLAASHIKTALKDVRNDAPEAVATEESRIFANTVRTFNDLNKGRGVSYIRDVYPGEVGTTPTGTINTSNGATDAFYSYWSGWQQYVRDVEGTEGRKLSLKRLRELEKEYFAPLRRVKSRQNFIDAAQNLPVFKATSGDKSFFYNDVHNQVDQAAEQLLQEILNPSSVDEPKG